MIINQKKDTTIPIVSIITPVLNGSKFIEQAITSVTNQKYCNIEYIIVDGGSTDGTIDIIKKYESRVTKWISEPDEGISDAFNKGINLSKGELIGIVNSDDWLEPDAIEKVVNKYLENSCDVICGAVRFWENEKEVIVSLPDVNNLIRETSVHHAAVFIKRSVYEKYGQYDTSYSYAMDYELMLRYKMAGLKFCTMNSIISNRRLEGLSYTHRRQALKEVKRARGKYFTKLNVLINYLYANLKDVLGRMLKNSHMKSLYSIYWNRKNKKLSEGKDH